VPPSSLKFSQYRKKPFLFANTEKEKSQTWDGMEMAAHRDEIKPRFSFAFSAKPAYLFM